MKTPSETQIRNWLDKAATWLLITSTVCAFILWVIFTASFLIEGDIAAALATIAVPSCFFGLFFKAIIHG
jgi:hypothetical protein